MASTLQKRTNHNSIVWTLTNNNKTTKKKESAATNDFKRKPNAKKRSSIYEASGKRSTLIQWIFNEFRNNGFLLFLSLSLSPALWLHCSRSLCNEFLSLNKITTLFTYFFFVCTLRLSSLHHLCLRYAFVLFRLTLHFSNSMRVFFCLCLSNSRTNLLLRTKHCMLLCANIFKR